MKEIIKGIIQKDYRTPIVEVYRLDDMKDILCMSNESNDNEFGAGGLGGFVDGN